MKRLFSILLFIALCTACNQPSASRSLNGFWSGVMAVGTTNLTLILDIEQREKNLQATLGCLEQGLSNLPVNEISYQDDILRFEVESLRITFQGRLDQEKDEIVGEFIQNQACFPLTLKLGPKPDFIALNRPQEPQSPFPYCEEEVKYENSDAEITLSGTLTLPESDEPIPAVILIAGSGKLDRNETLYGHKPFLVLADHLTRQGIAVLRYDKRGIGQSTGVYENSTSQDFASDVLAGIDYLKSRNEIDHHRIGLIGHSEGGLIAPIVATQSNDVAYIIMLGAPGAKGEEILYAQGELLQRADGIEEEVIALNRKLRESVFAILKQEPDQAKAKEQLHDYFTKHLESAPPTSEISNPTQAQEMIKFLNDQWFRSFLVFDPYTVLKEIKIPVLALNGELDLQVPASQNLPSITKALEEAGNIAYTIKELPGLNHLFQTCQTGSISEYAKIEETISPLVLEIITDWICERDLSQEIVCHD